MPIAPRCWTIAPGSRFCRPSGSSRSSPLRRGLAVSEDPLAKASGGYGYQRQRQAPAPAAPERDFQDQLMARLAQLTGIPLF